MLHLTLRAITMSDRFKSPFFPSSVPFPDELSTRLKACMEAATRAGRLLKEGFGTDYQVLPKAMKNDLVTEFDHASEKLIMAFLSDHFPDHSFLCEESGHTMKEDTDYCWVVDPLDGTVNFAHNIPLFCVSIALAKGNEVICGVIYEPITEELFAVEKNMGVYLNGQPIKVSQTKNLEHSFISTSLSFNLHKDPNTSIKKFREMAYKGFPLRAIGSTALNLAYIAAGRFDAYWSVGGSVNTWDMAAGKLMVEEAGGLVTQCDGKPYDLYLESTILATNRHLHQEMQNSLEDFTCLND